MGRWAQRRVRGGGPSAEAPAPVVVHMIVGQIPGGDGTFVARITYSGDPPDPTGLDPTFFTCDGGGTGTAWVAVGVNQYEITFDVALFDGTGVVYNAGGLGPAELLDPDSIVCFI